MQWLIDIIAERVIATIGIPPVFIDRGDPAAADFDKNDITTDNAWHELDLSSIVPANAKGVLLSVVVINVDVNKRLAFRKNGNSNDWNIAPIQSTVSGVTEWEDLVTPCDEDRKIEYKSSTTTWTIVYITVKAWWF